MYPQVRNVCCFNPVQQIPVPSLSTVESERLWRWEMNAVESFLTTMLTNDWLSMHIGPLRKHRSAARRPRMCVSKLSSLTVIEDSSGNLATRWQVPLSVSPAEAISIHETQPRPRPGCVEHLRCDHKLLSSVADIICDKVRLIGGGNCNNQRVTNTTNYKHCARVSRI